MAFDGITIAAMVSELNKNLSGGRINKIAQPQAHRKRQDHCDPPAWSGACCRI